MPDANDQIKLDIVVDGQDQLNGMNDAFEKATKRLQEATKAAEAARENNKKYSDSSEEVSKKVKKVADGSKELSDATDKTTKSFRRAQDGTTQLLEGLNAFGREIGETASVAHNFVDVIVGFGRGLDPTKIALAAVAAGVYLIYQNFDKLAEFFKSDKLKDNLINFGTDLESLKGALKTASDGLAEIKKNGIESLDSLEKYYDLRLKIANTEAAIAKQMETQSRIKQADKDTPSQAEKKASIGKEFTEHIDDEAGKTKADLKEALLSKMIDDERTKVKNELAPIDAEIKDLEERKAKATNSGSRAVLNDKLKKANEKRDVLITRDQRLNLRGTAEMEPLKAKVGDIINGSEQGDENSLNQIQSLLPNTKFAQYVEDSKNQTLKASAEDDKLNQKLAAVSEKRRKEQAENQAKILEQFLEADNKAYDKYLKFIDDLNDQGKENEAIWRKGLDAQTDNDQKWLENVGKDLAEQKKTRDEVTDKVVEKFQPVFSAAQSNLDTLRVVNPREANKQAADLNTALRSQLIGTDAKPGPLAKLPKEQQEQAIGETLDKLRTVYDSQVKFSAKGIRDQTGLSPGNDVNQMAISSVAQTSRQAIAASQDMVTIVQDLQAAVLNLQSRVKQTHSKQHQTRSQLSR